MGTAKLTVRDRQEAGRAPNLDAKRRKEQARRSSKLLSDPIRLRIVLSLADGEQHVGALCEHLSQSQPAVSHQLALLRHGGIISPRREGKNNFYSLTQVGKELAEVLHSLHAPSLKKVKAAPVQLEAKDKGAARLIRDIASVVDDPNVWLDTPNPQFQGQKPRDLIGTDNEPILRNLIQAAMQGMFS